MNKKNYIYLALAVFLIVLTFFNYYLYFSNQPLKEERYSISLEVSNTSGFNLDEGVLDFSETKPGTSKSRKVSVKNFNDFPLTAYTNVEGNISQFISYKNNFSLGVNESKEINFIVNVPENSSMGKKYSGEAVVKLFRANQK